MRTALDDPPDRLDEHEAEFVRKIREFGWHRMNILPEPPHPGFTFTTGFWSSLGAPEIIIFGLSFKVAGAILTDLYAELGAGRALPTGVRLEGVFGNADAYVFEVAKTQYVDHLGWSRWFYGDDDFPCLQLVWPDRDGRFPWEAGFDETLRPEQADLTAGGWQGAVAN